MWHLGYNIQNLQRLYIVLLKCLIPQHHFDAVVETSQKQNSESNRLQLKEEMRKLRCKKDSLPVSQNLLRGNWQAGPDW